MRFRIVIASVVVLLGCAVSASAQAVSLQFNNGRVTLNAQNAPVRTILTEWSRLGGTRIINGDRVGGAPVTLELTDVPEREALNVLLRSVSGYVVTQRDGTAGASTLGGVVILATSSAPRLQAPITFGAATAQPRSQFEPDQEERAGAAPVLPPVQTPPPTQPAVVRFPTNTSFGQADPPQAPMPPGQQRPVTTLQTLPGTSRPGEITPPPPTPQPAR